MDSSIIIILRVIHVLAGIVWVGGTLFMWLFITPTLQRLGPDAGKFMRTLLLDGPYVIGITALNILTVLAGLLLYFHTSGKLSSDWMRTPQGIVLSIGAVTGLLAAGMGIFMILPVVRKIQALMRAIQGPPSPEQAGMMQGYQAKMRRYGNMILVMMLISVVCMESFRYVGG
jgi:uncharacterized membrane protein